MAESYHKYHQDMMDIIRGNSVSSFTRHRKVTPDLLLIQMLAQHGVTQRKEIRILLEDSGMTDIEISDVGFYKARMKYNPEAVNSMLNTFIDDELKIRKKVTKIQGLFRFSY